jgi:hypothetical protein
MTNRRRRSKRQEPVMERMVINTAMIGLDDGAVVTLPGLDMRQLPEAGELPPLLAVSTPESA